MNCINKQLVSELAQLILHDELWPQKYSAQEVARKCDMKLDRRSVPFATQSLHSPFWKSSHVVVMYSVTYSENRLSYGLWSFPRLSAIIGVCETSSNAYCSQKFSWQHCQVWASISVAALYEIGNTSVDCPQQSRAYKSSLVSCICTCLCEPRKIDISNSWINSIFYMR